ncbi:MAG: hypothetical protein NT173_03085, partial [Opitutales bacterium]|nr:hypothetical protein [Opitutales bacterium]
NVLAAVGVPQNADLVLGRVSFAFHGLGSFQVAQTNTRPGSVSGGHVKPPGVRDLILHCLHPEPNGRPTAAQMVQAMNGEMVTAAPPGGMGLKAAQVVALNVLNPASGQLAAGREILARPGILPS